MLPSRQQAFIILLVYLKGSISGCQALIFSRISGGLFRLYSIFPKWFPFFGVVGVIIRISYDDEIMEMISERKAIILLNKSDLESVVKKEKLQARIDKKMIPVSAKEGTGIEELEEAIKDMFFQGEISFNDEIYSPYALSSSF